MATVQQLPAQLNLLGVGGDPFTLSIKAIFATPTGTPLPNGTITASVVVVTNGTSSQPGLAPSLTWATGVFSLVWTKTQTTTIMKSSVPLWWYLDSTIKATGPLTLLAGTLRMVPPQDSAAQSASSAILTVSVGQVEGTLNVTLGTTTVSAVPASSLTPGTHITITTVSGKAKVSAPSGGATQLAALDATGHLRSTQSEALTGNVTKPAGSSTTTVAAVPGPAILAGTHVSKVTTSGKVKINVGGGGATGLAQLDSGAHLKSTQTAAFAGDATKAAGSSTVTVSKMNGHALGAATGPALLDATAHLTQTESPAITGDVTKAAGSSAATVTKLQGHTVTTGTPKAGQRLRFTTTNGKWVFATDFPFISGLTTAGNPSATNATLIAAALNGTPGTSYLPSGIIALTSPIFITAAGRSLLGEGTGVTQSGVTVLGTGTALVAGPNLRGPLIWARAKSFSYSQLTLYGKAYGTRTTPITAPLVVFGTATHTASSPRIRRAQHIGARCQVFGWTANQSQNLRITTQCTFRTGTTPGVVETTTSTHPTAPTLTITVASAAGIKLGMLVLNISRRQTCPESYVTKVTGTTITLAVAIKPHTGDTIAFLGGVGPVIASGDSVLNDTNCIAGALPVLAGGDNVANGAHFSTPTTRATSATKTTSATVTTSTFTGAGTLHTTAATLASPSGTVAVATKTHTSSKTQAVISYTGVTTTGGLQTLTGCTLLRGGGKLKTGGVIIQQKLGYNVIVRNPASTSVSINNSTIDNGNTSGQGLIWKLGGGLVLNANRYQNGGTLTFPVVYTQRFAATTTGTAVTAGTIPVLGHLGAITSIVKYAGTPNPYDRIDPSLTVEPTAMKVGTVAGTGGVTRWNSQPLIATAGVYTPAPYPQRRNLARITGPTAAFTVANPATTNGAWTDGETILLRIKCGATAYGITWGVTYLSSGVATLPTLCVANKTITCGFTYDSVRAKWVLLSLDAVGY